MVLVLDDPVEVTSSLRQPSLTQTCHQVRKETIGLWYTSNLFESNIEQYDAKVAHLWDFHCKAVGQQVKVKYTVHGGRDRRNMEVWLGNRWEDGIVYVAQSGFDGSTAQKLMHDFFTVLNDHLDHPWEDFLEDIRLRSLALVREGQGLWHFWRLLNICRFPDSSWQPGDLRWT